jgi:hypothetical protein
MIQVESVERPFTDPDLAMPAFEVCKRAYAMGLLDDDMKVDLNVAGLRKILRVVFKAGIGSDAEVRAKTLGPEFDAAAKQALLVVLASVMDAMEVSPAPDSEWRRLTKVFEPEQLAELLGISPVSLRRYQSNARQTPDDVAARLHYLALVTADLGGAYNEIGIRRWFQRKRTLLDGHAPGELLRAGWLPEAPGAARVRALARSLTASPAT